MSDSYDFPRIQDQPLQLEPLLAWGLHPECGGLALFGGTVRNHHDAKPVVRLTYTAYAPLAEKQIREIEAAVAARHGVPYLRVVHRVRSLEIGDVAIYCVARAAHRAEAFAACREAVDRTKHEVPIWKQEFYADGSSAFVEGCCIRPQNDDEHDHADHEQGHDHAHAHRHAGATR